MFRSLSTPRPERNTEAFDAPDPRELIAACLAGNRIAFWQLWEHFQRPVFSRCLKAFRFNYHDAEDASQETFAAVLTCPASWPPAAEFPFWLNAVCRNVCVGVRRQRTASKRLPAGGFHDLPEDNDLDLLPDADEAKRDYDLEHDLRLAIGVLPHHLREVVDLRFRWRLTYEEIADQLDINERTARKWFRRAARKLADILRERGVVTRKAGDLC